MSDLGVSIQFNLVDRLTGGMRNIQASVGRVSQAFKTTAKSAADLDKEMERVNKRMQNAAFLSLAAGRLEQTASRMRAGVRANVEAIRPLEKSLGALKSLGMTDMDVITKKGIEMQKQWAGVSAAGFADAAYDIKSGLSHLSDTDVAGYTAQMVMTAKATKASEKQMTSLGATGHGIFKQLYQDATDLDFGGKFSAGIAAAVNLFKTEGPEMQSAIERAGAGLSLLNAPMYEQITLLGMLQKTMGSGQLAGTSVKMFSATASTAQQAFDDLGYSIDLIDAEGKMMPMLDFLRSMKAEFGTDWNANIGDIVKEAFGTQEALNVVQNMWSQVDAFEANSKAIQSATEQGMAYTKNMATLMDANFDSKLVLFAQQMDAVRISIGNAMKPWISAVLPLISFFGRLAGAVMRVPILGKLVGGIILGVTLLVSAMAGLATIMAVGYGVFAIYGQGQLFLHTNNLTLIGGYRMLATTMLGGMKKAILWSISGLYSMATAAWTAMTPFLPLIAVVAAVAGAAFLIYKFWGPISGFFVKLWGGIKPGLLSVWKLIQTVFGFSPLGMILKNWRPIIDFFEGMWKRVGGILGKLGALFHPKSAMAGAMAGAAVASAPMAAPASMGNITPIEKTISEARVNSSSSIHAPITINAAPGQNPEQIAAAVTRQLDARQRANAARTRSRLHD
jgi:TP901 family phage tail tape measure protein